MKKLLALLLLFGIVGCATMEEQMIAYESLGKNKASAIVIEPNFRNDGALEYDSLTGKWSPISKDCTTKGDKICFVSDWALLIEETFQCYDQQTEAVARKCALDACSFGNWVFWGTCILNDVNGKDVTNEEVDRLIAEKISVTEQTYLRNEVRREAAANKLEFDRLQKARLAEYKKEQEQKQMQSYIDSKKRLCTSYGFVGENAIAGCVQSEIKSDILNFQNQQAYANAQARANAQSRSRAMSSYSRCLSTAGETFGSCANAWNGYTPKPAKKVYKCDYDVFGNQISSTCREQ